ncbi:MAG: peptidylprolyl isomerase [Leptospiraceae bacterium]|nr:peptidylprolyl isomerase [Leptospiraceae bacterium]
MNFFKLIVLFSLSTQILFCKDKSFQKPTYKPADYTKVEVVVRKKEDTTVALPDKKAIFAIIDTNKGNLLLELYHDNAPLTVQNFIDLAQGEKEFLKQGEKVKKPFYNGLTFHRVIAGFMVQGGCPNGDGTGGPGYSFDDEINAVSLGLDKVKVKDAPSYGRLLQKAVLVGMGIKSQQELESRITEAEENLKQASEMSVLEVLARNGYKYNEVITSKKALKGALAMANSGPNTNGSQFFINEVNTPHLDGLHTVFGQLLPASDTVFAQIVKDGNAKTIINKVVIVDRREGVTK